MVTRRAFAITLTLAACSSKADVPPPSSPPTPPFADAAAIDGITSFGAPDPNAHVDEDPTPISPRPSTRRPGRQIEILLRSSPPGALASVDGLQVGTTPTYWVGETGAEHEFTFSLPKHALARYRFFPIATGTLHAQLDPIANDIDAGVPPPHLVAPPPIPPPETLVTPAPVAVDAAPAPSVPDAGAPVLPPVDGAGGPAIGPTP